MKKVHSTLLKMAIPPFLLILSSPSPLFSEEEPSPLKAGRKGSEYERQRIWSLGIEFFGFKDDEEVNASFGIGPSLTIPLTVEIYRGFGIRTGFSGGYSRGSALIDYSLQSGLEISPTHMAFYEMFFDLYFTFKFHPSFNLITPYVGIGPAIFWVYTYPDLPENLFMLLDPEQNDMNDPNNIDPYSVNVETGFNLFIGFHFYLSRVVNFNLEFSLDSAYLDEAGMRKSAEEYDYTRPPYNLTLVRIGGGIEFKF